MKTTMLDKVFLLLGRSASRVSVDRREIFTEDSAVDFDVTFVTQAIFDIAR